MEPAMEIVETVSVARPKPLVVDLDGTLLRSDLLYETAFAELARRPQAVLGMIAALREGKAALKHLLASRHDFDPAVLPYDEGVLDLLRQAREAGRPVYLASASSRLLVEPIAAHLGLFDGWFASDTTTNLSSETKASVLVDAFGERGFDYLGNDAADLAVWRRSDRALAIRTRPRVARRLQAGHGNVEFVDAAKPTLRTWLKLLRVHQYTKNALIFVAVLTSHSFTGGALLSALGAFVAFSLCASSVYILNDLADLGADRAHPTKRNRPLANGTIPLAEASVVCVLLLVLGLAVGAAVSPPFLAILLVYLGLTTSYSFYLKRKFFLDVITLASLYTVRVAAGAIAIGVAMSHWLLAFSIFVFTCLALIKRYIELAVRLDAGLPDPTNRNYRVSDLPMVLAMAAATGFNAITVLALYVASDDVVQLYSRPHLLWLICPLLMYWIGRAIMFAHRRVMDDDPIVFAIKDRVSLMTAGLVALIVLAASA
jgi:4-hydroxybenzoate polyprenyltransferase/phosphoserine phosphatase